MQDLIQDLSTLTTIGKYNLDQLVQKSISIISHDVEESLRDFQNVTSIDIGIGTLHIQHVDSTIKYKFIPSKKLDDVVVNTIINRKSDLTIQIDKTLGERINNTYKDMF
jgi:hypothetical protein